jgi:hypothetical protein
MKYQRPLSMKPASGTNTVEMARILSLEGSFYTIQEHFEWELIYK